MPRSKEISEELRKQVVEAYQSGKGYKLISKALGLSRTTIRSILRKWKQFGTVMTLPRSGRPPKISISTRREIIREVMKNPCTTSKDIQAALAAVNISVHDSTIRRILEVHGSPTLSGFQDVMALRHSSNEEEGTHEVFGKLAVDSSDGFRKDVKVENEQQDLDEHGSMNNGRGGAECCDGRDNDDCGGGCGDGGAGDDADSDSSDDMVYKYDDDDDDDDDGISYNNGCGGDDNDGESCDEETEGDSTLR